MKKFILALVLLTGIASFNYSVEAQNINISINIGRQPAWGPVGYDYAGYYYFPDIDCYYDVNVGMFYYMNRGRWISARYLPYAYRHYDLYNLYKVVLNVRDPWRHHHIHYRDYARYRGHKNQFVIRDSRDMRYRDSRNNRVTWYSNDKKHYNNKKEEYRYNDNRYSKNNKKEYNYNNDNRRQNNSKQKYNSNKSNQRKDYKQSEARPNRNTGRNDNNKKSNNSSNSSRYNSNNRSTSNVRQASSSRSTNQSKEYRLVSGNERSTSRGR